MYSHGTWSHFMLKYVKQMPHCTIKRHEIGPWLIHLGHTYISKISLSYGWPGKTSKSLHFYAVTFVSVPSVDYSRGRRWFDRGCYCPQLKELRVTLSCDISLPTSTVYSREQSWLDSGAGTGEIGTNWVLKYNNSPFWSGSYTAVTCLRPPASLP